MLQHNSFENPLLIDWAVIEGQLSSWMNVFFELHLGPFNFEQLTQIIIHATMSWNFSSCMLTWWNWCFRSTWRKEVFSLGFVPFVRFHFLEKWVRVKITNGICVSVYGVGYRLALMIVKTLALGMLNTKFLIFSMLNTKTCFIEMFQMSFMFQIDKAKNICTVPMCNFSEGKFVSGLKDKSCFFLSYLEYNGKFCEWA